MRFGTMMGESAVFKGTQVSFEHQYKDPKSKWWRRYDAGRNEYDEAFDDFFRWVSETWSNLDTQAELLERAWRMPRSLLLKSVP